MRYFMKLYSTYVVLTLQSWQKHMVIIYTVFWFSAPKCSSRPFSWLWLTCGGSERKHTDSFHCGKELRCSDNNRYHWCAILIAHQLSWQIMGAPVSILQESRLAGELSERLFHIHNTTVTKSKQKIFTRPRYCDCDMFVLPHENNL